MRVGYIDEQSRKGELELAHVRQGDLVRFTADFDKIGKDEIGEVVSVYPEGLRVSAPGRKSAGGELTLATFEVDVRPENVMVLVDARDERISSYRIDAVRRDVAVDDLSDWLSRLAAEDFPVHRADLFGLETLRRGHYRMARLVRGTPPVAWAMFVSAEGLWVPRQARRVTAAGVDMDAVSWALKAMRGAYTAAHGREPSMENRHDVIWALHEMHQDIMRGIMESDFELREDDSGMLAPEPSGGPAAGETAEWEAVAARFEETLLAVKGMSDEDWAQEAGGHRTPEMKRALESYRDYFRLHPGRPRLPEAEMAKVKYPKLFEEAQAEAEEIWRTRGREMGLFDAPPQLEVIPGGGGAPAGPPPVAAEEPREVEFSTDPSLAPPLKVAQGRGTHRVRATPGMPVYHDQGGPRGKLLGFSTTQPDGLVIETEDGQRLVVDSMAMRLSPQWTGRPSIVPPKEVDAWKKARNYRLRYEKRDTGEAA